MGNMHDSGIITEDKNPNEKCLVCGHDMPAIARVCVKCGAPRNRLGRFAFVHKNTVTAIGTTTAIIGLAFIIFNLFSTLEQMKMQRSGFIEEYQPKIETTYLKYEYVNDTLTIYIRFDNIGLSDALEIKGDITFLKDIADTIVIFPKVIDRLTGKSSVIQIFDAANAEKIYGSPFYVSIDLKYIWSGETKLKSFNAYYHLKFDSNSNKYIGHEVSRKDLLP